MSLLQQSEDYHFKGETFGDLIGFAISCPAVVARCNADKKSMIDYIEKKAKK